MSGKGTCGLTFAAGLARQLASSALASVGGARPGAGARRPHDDHRQRSPTCSANPRNAASSLDCSASTCPPEAVDGAVASNACPRLVSRTTSRVQ